MNGLYIKVGDNNVYFSNSRSMARFGIFLQAKGKWNAQVILDSAYFNQMINSSQSINESYGLLTWLNGKSSYMIPQTQFVFNGPINPDGPSDSFFALGKNGQLINVAPTDSLVWIRMGDAPGLGGGLISSTFNNEIWKRINALQCLPVSIPNSFDKNEIKIFPNPSSGIVQIDHIENLNSFKIYSLQGTEYQQYKCDNGTNPIELKGLKSGTYIFEGLTKSGIIIHKCLIIQK